MKLAYMGMGFGANGYGTISSRLAKALKAAGATLLPGTRLDYDAAVVVGAPYNWLFGRTGTRPDLVYHTMFEVDPIPTGWADLLNRAGLLWCPTSYVADLFRSNGIRTPMFVSGYGVDTTIFYPVDRGDRTGPVKYRVWANNLVGRKNALMAARAFQAAGLPADEAELQIKINAGYPDCAFKTSSGSAIPNISVIAADWPIEDMADWLRDGDVGIYLSGGEGYGLMPLEMMATGLPVICAANTGMLDYLTGDNSLRVPTAGYAEAVTYKAQFRLPMTWAVPDFDAVVAHIRWCFEHRGAARQIGQCGASTAQTLTWERAGRTAYDQIADFYGVD